MRSAGTAPHRRAFVHLAMQEGGEDGTHAKWFGLVSEDDPGSGYWPDSSGIGKGCATSNMRAARSTRSSRYSAAAS